MPWINLTLRRGALPKPVQHAVMAKLTEVLMWWEKVPDAPAARKFLKAWVYEVAEVGCASTPLPSMRWEHTRRRNS
jgi:hypothetical protein